MLILACLIICALNLNTCVFAKSSGSVNSAKYLLPNKFIPLNYDLKLDVRKTFKEGSFDGTVEIRTIINDNIDYIFLHKSKDMKLKRISVEKFYQELYENHEYDADREFLKIKLNKKLQKGTPVLIIISYTGYLQDNISGLYQSQSDYEYLLLTNLQPTHARKVFPCFDEPKYTTTINLKIFKPSTYSVLSNTGTESLSNIYDQYVTFTEIRNISTHSIGFLVHTLENSCSVEDELFKIWTRPSALYQTKFGLNIARIIMNYLYIFTNAKYKIHINKMDFVALPDHTDITTVTWNLMIFRETNLLVDEAKSTSEDLQRITLAINHAMSHQFFGNIIKLNWWNNTWLFEGIATYFAYHVTDEIQPEWEVQNQFVLEQQKVFELDSSENVQPLNLWHTAPSKIISHFDFITHFNKPGCILRMLERFLGTEIIQKGLGKYITENILQIVDATKLWSSLQNVINAEKRDFDDLNMKDFLNHIMTLDYSIDDIMTTWTNQAGYPVVTVEEESPGLITFSQKRFLLNSTPVNKITESWYIPITYTTANKKNYDDFGPRLWLTPNEPSKTLSLKSYGYIIVNIQASGYYRVNYDENLWLNIAAALKANKNNIHRLNRAQLIDDVMNLAKAGLTNYNIAFNLLDYLIDEYDYFPWHAAFQAFRSLLQNRPEDDSDGIKLKEYLKSLMQNIAEKTDFMDIEENHIHLFHRMQTLEWACYLGFEKCVSEATSLFRQYKDESKEIIPKNLRFIVYKTAIQYGTKEDWIFLWNKYLCSNLISEKIEILKALTYSTDDIILFDFLNMTLYDDRILKEDRHVIFKFILEGSTKGKNIALKFLKDNYNQIRERYRNINLYKPEKVIKIKIFDYEENDETDSDLDENLQEDYEDEEIVKDEYNRTKFEETTKNEVAKLTTDKTEEVILNKIDETSTKKIDKTTIKKIDKTTTNIIDKTTTNKIDQTMIIKIDKTTTNKIEKITSNEIEKTTTNKIEKTTINEITETTTNATTIETEENVDNNLIIRRKLKDENVANLTQTKYVIIVSSANIISHKYVHILGLVTVYLFWIIFQK